MRQHRACLLATLTLLGAYPAAEAATAPTHPDTALVTTIAMPGRPFGMAVSSLGRAYVTLLDLGLVSETTSGFDRIDGVVGVSSVPTAVAFAPDGATAYVTNQHSFTVGVIDVACGRQTAQIAASANTFRVAIAPDGVTGYATVSTGQLLVIDLAAQAQVASIEVGGYPNGLILDNAGHLYVSSVHDGAVRVIDTARRSVSRTIPVPGVAQDLALSPDGSTLYVADESGIDGDDDLGRIHVIETATGKLLEPLRVAGSPFALGLSPDGNHLYCSASAQGIVSIVDLAKRSVVKTIIAGCPRRIAFDPSGEVCYIADEGAGVIVVGDSDGAACRRLSAIACR
jgi:YVTN family beta-propeller protein